MASFFSSVRQGFNRQASKSPNPQQQAEQGHVNQQQTSSPTFQATSSTSPVPPSPGLPQDMSFPNQATSQSPGPRKPPYFFREEYSGLIVKGNFMTLAAKPVHVDEGEWLAHQVVEQWRLLESMIAIIRVDDEKTGQTICNSQTCPTMSASAHTYTWLDTNKRPIKIPAHQYIGLVQRWINGKIHDPTLFPTDSTNPSASAYASGGLNTPTSNTPIPTGPTSLNVPLSALAGREWLGKPSGFPETFEQDLRSIYRQMMRCYAHIYHGHWLSPFWDLNSYKELNTCFIHFINVGRLYKLIGDKDMEPMQPLIDLWLTKGLLPPPQQEQPQQQQPAQGQTQAQAANPSQIQAQPPPQAPQAIAS